MPGVHKKYRSKLVTPEEAVKVVRSHQMVQYNSFNGVPPTLDRALAARRDELEGVIINTSVVLFPLYTISSDPSQEHFLYDNWQASGVDRKLADKGNYYYVPTLYYEMPLIYEREKMMDVVMVHVAPMDKEGYFNLRAQCGAH